MKKFTVYPKSVKSSISAAARSKHTYTIEYYLNICAAERRPATVADVEDDYREEKISVSSDLEAFQYAVGIADGYDVSEIDDPELFEYIQSEYPDIESCKYKLDSADTGFGGLFICNISKGNKRIFDFGIDKDWLLSRAHDEDDEDDYWDYADTGFGGLYR